MRKVLLLIGLLFLFIKPIYAAQTSITEAEGSACMGDDKSRKQTEQAALIDAKKKAVESVSTRIISETTVKNYEIEKDLLSAYANAEVKIIQELEKMWYKDATTGDCCKIKIKAEIIPSTKKLDDQLSFAGNWAGTFRDPVNQQSGSLSITISKNNKVVGSIYNSAAGVSGSVSGVISNSGTASFTYTYPGILYTTTGIVAVDRAGHLVGNFNEYSGKTLFGTAIIDLIKQ